MTMGGSSLCFASAAPVHSLAFPLLSPGSPMLCLRFFYAFSNLCLPQSFVFLCFSFAFPFFPFASLGFHMLCLLFASAAPVFSLGFPMLCPGCPYAFPKVFLGFFFPCASDWPPKDISFASICFPLLSFALQSSLLCQPPCHSRGG